MSESDQRLESTPPGAVAWLDVSAETADAWPGTVRTGPLGLQITALPGTRSPYFFRGARLRGARCIWSAATVSGAELTRRGRRPVAGSDTAVQLLVRLDCGGTAFEPSGPAHHATLAVLDAAQDVREQFTANTHLFTLDVQRGTIGVEPATLADMMCQTYDLTQFQEQLVRSAVGLLASDADELSSAASLVGVDRYLGALAGLLLRTAVHRPGSDIEQLESIRGRADTIVFEQASDVLLSPATIAAQLNISLRQLYRAFDGTESPAARIRRRRLERAADLLTARGAPAQLEKVARQSGFISAEYFSRAFRREFGLSPRAYRSAHRGRPNPGKDVKASADLGRD